MNLSITGPSLSAAFLVGLLGGVHCVGMCGGLVGAFSLSQSPVRRRPSTAWSLVLGYNVGRIGSYSFAGALAGGVGSFAANLVNVRYAQLALAVLAALFMLVLGLYLAGWWRGLAVVERLGEGFWKRLAPLGRCFMPVHSFPQAIVLGTLWGWMPCGLVYSVLIWAMAAGGADRGAALMMAFGLGTLPNLALMGLVGGGLAVSLQHPWLRAGTGVVVIGLGILNLTHVFWIL